VWIVDRLVATWNASVDWLRRHSKAFDHFWRARQRYNEQLGGRLAAAIAYYGFFAVFALGVVAYSIVGYVLANSPAAYEAVNRFLQQNIPFLNAQQIADSRSAVALIGLIGLVFTGVGWIEAVRSSQRAIWHLDQQPGNLVVRRLVDLAILVGIGLLLALSLWVQTGINDAIAPVQLWLSPTVVSVGAQNAIETTVKIVANLLGLLVNAVLAASLLSGVARLRMSVRRLWSPTLLVAAGLLVLSSIGRLYIDYSAHRPAFQIVGGTVAILLFLYFFNQLVLFGAALAATSRHGTVTDLAAGPPDAAVLPYRFGERSS
jgi:membrane protein